MTARWLKTDSCHHCKAQVYLVRTGVDTYKWVTNPKRPSGTWKCNTDRDHPLRSHAPQDALWEGRS